MLRRNILFSLVLLTVLAGSWQVLAHEVTYMGTVTKVGDQKIEVQVVDDKTRKESLMTFDIADTTRVFRGDKEVKFADAHIQTKERIAVTVNHDTAATRATVLRLAAH